MSPITKEEWMDWKALKVTQEFLRRVQETRETLKEGLAEGHAGSNDELNRSVGQCQGIKDVVVYALRDFDVVAISSQEEK